MTISRFEGGAQRLASLQSSALTRRAMEQVVAVRYAAAISVLASCLCLAGCDVQLFSSCKSLGSTPYVLCQWEDGETYYLEDDGQESSGGGVIEGTVKAIGFNQDVVVARRYAISRGDPDGWMVVRVKEKSVSGPISDSEVMAQFPGMKFKSAKDEWRSL